MTRSTTLHIASARTKDNEQSLSDSIPDLTRALQTVVKTQRRLTNVLLVLVVVSFINLIVSSTALGLVGKTAIAVDNLATKTVNSGVFEVAPVITAHLNNVYIPGADRLINDTAAIANVTLTFVKKYERYLLTQGERLLDKVDTLFGLNGP